MTFKVGDKIKVIKACNCKYWTYPIGTKEACGKEIWLSYGVINRTQSEIGPGYKYGAEIQNKGKGTTICGFRENQLELIEKLSQYEMLKREGLI